MPTTITDSPARISPNLSPDQLRSLRSVLLPVATDLFARSGGLSVTHLGRGRQEYRAEFRSTNERDGLVTGLTVIPPGGQTVDVHLGQRPRPSAILPESPWTLLARTAQVRGDVLDLSAGSSWLHPAPPVVAATVQQLREAREQVLRSWIKGVSYRESRHGMDGFRPAQSGALGALRAHWTLRSQETAVIVMPTGTGKTEVMLAAAVDHRCSTLLVVVPTDALRVQTTAKFRELGILKKLRVIDAEYLLPVVGMLRGRPRPEDLDLLAACNVVVTTMAAVAAAPLEMQREIGRRCSHLFMDEAHHAPAETWQRLRECFPGKPVLQFTATPFREDGRRLEGRLIYNYPLVKAQEDDCFRPIRFAEVVEWDHPDKAIAERAVMQLREDLTEGFDHLLMARAATVEQARQVHEIYVQICPDLEPALIYNGSPGQRLLMDEIRGGRRRVIVCVNMLGEGFDLPQLKIAALHGVHKSLAVTLQFIGRFTRSAAGLGRATVVANTADLKVSEALEDLYTQDAVWDRLLPRLSAEAMEAQTGMAEFLGGLTTEGSLAQPEAISASTLTPTCSAQVFKVDGFSPGEFPRSLHRGQEVVDSWTHEEGKFAAFVIRHQVPTGWTTAKSVAQDMHELFLLFYDRPRRLLFLHSSIKRYNHSKLAQTVSGPSARQLKGEMVFRVFDGLQRLIFYNIGLNRIGRGKTRYQMFTGSDVADAIDPVQQNGATKANLFGSGYLEGKRITVGGSHNGIIWSMQPVSIPAWQTWCLHLGTKLLDQTIPTDGFFAHTYVPTEAASLPVEAALSIDWPALFFERASQDIYFVHGGQQISWLEAELRLGQTWTSDSFNFTLVFVNGSDIEFCAHLDDSGFRVALVGSTRVEVKLGRRPGSSRHELAEFLSEHPPLLRFADGSELRGQTRLVRRTPAEEFHYPVGDIRAVDWSGVDITVESQWKHGQHRAHSVQRRVLDLLLADSSYRIIMDDDDAGEVADVVAIRENDRIVEVELFHCKYAGGARASSRVSDFYEVCGQAQKSVSWTHSLDLVIDNLIHREQHNLNGRSTRFERGGLNDLAALRRSARRKNVRYRIGIVQPGISVQDIQAEHTAMLGAASFFVREVTGVPLLVWTSV